MGERCSGPVQTSAVYLMGTSAFPARPPPSPPSPVTPANEQDLCTPIEELSLDAVDSAITASPAGRAASVSPGPPSVVAGPSSASKPNNKTPRPQDSPVLSSPPATAPASAPDSPDFSPCVLSPNGSSCSLNLSAAVASPLTSTSASSSAKLPASLVAARLAGAVHVLATEASALQSVAQLYATSPAARDGFHQAVDAIVRTQTAHPPGKLVVVGVGKSGHIGRKLVATFNSLAVSASFLHPTEALHGDLGHIRPHDALLFITYSGKTQELVTLLPHVDPALPLIILTSHVTAETCELIRQRNELAADAGVGARNVDGTPEAAAILLPAPIPVEEKVSFGVAAPTASTTTALAVGDALAIVTSKELHPSTESVFRRNHPGGAIGDAFRRTSSAAALRPPPRNDTIRQLAVPWREIPVVQAPPDCADVLRAGYSSANGWVRVVKADANNDDDNDNDNDNLEYIASPSRIRGLLSSDLVRPVHEVPGLVVGRPDFVAVAADTKVRKAAEWLRAVANTNASEEGDGNEATPVDAVVSVIDNGEIVGVLELQDLLKAHSEIRA
ncbi:hypothetical protein SCUCBS95973_007003 [Sporothrix curviconia]|uniref:SIS domain-containing protein n=1 Tax=Sporothrix curviconia TaxID=1260050 RepID=A0ABP0CCC4_9PEZI